MRFGFGDKTGEAEKSGVNQYENGHVDVSSSALSHVVENYPRLPPKEAVGAMLLGRDPSGLSDGAEVDYDALRESLTDIEGVGEETAGEVIDAVNDALTGGD